MGIADFKIEVLIKAKINFFIREEEILIERSSAIKFLGWLSTQDKTPSGMEGFTFDGINLTPIMECIQDYPTGESRSAAEFFTYILESDKDWQNRPHFIEFITN